MIGAENTLYCPLAGGDAAAEAGFIWRYAEGRHGLVHVHVNVNQPGRDDAVAGIDRLGARGEGHKGEKRGQ